jgi:hypothetical protein
MEKKDLIIGAFTKYKDYNVLKPWVKSIKDSGFSGDIVMVAIEAEPGIIEELKSAGVKVVVVDNAAGTMVHMLRFLYIYDLLNRNRGKYRYVISTDVRDVIFQSNPSDWLEQNLHTNFLAQSEAILIQDEAWNRENIIKNFGGYFYSVVAKEEVCNVGILAGKQDYVRDMCFNIYQMSLNRADWVADQAAYNMIIHSHIWKQNTEIADLSSAWALNAHVTNKPDQLDEFGPFLLEERPYMEEGLVKNSKGKPFCIVHQYDRVPEWANYYYKKYETNLTKDIDLGTSPKYFTYNSEE